MIRTLALLTVSTLLFGITFATGQDTSDPLQAKSVWANEKNNKMVLTITERKDESFKALFGDREVNGKINGPSIFWLSKDVRALGKSGVGGDNYGFLKKDDLGFKIDFTWQNKPTGPKGFFTLRQVINNNVATNVPNTKKDVVPNVPNTKNTPANLKEIKDEMKPKTIVTNQTNEQVVFPDSQKIFLEKLIEIRKIGRFLNDPKKNKLNAFGTKAEMEKNEKQNQELKMNFEGTLVSGQIKKWQGKITVDDARFRILIGNLNDTFTYSKEETEERRKDKEEDRKAKKPASKVVAPLMYIAIEIDSGLDKSISESLKKVSNYDSIEFSIKKFLPPFKQVVGANWQEAKYNQPIEINIDSKYLEFLTPVAK